MNVEQVMTRGIRTCRPEDTLKTAASIMWNRDCGIVPVVDAGSRILGVITDRDICMAACLQDARLTDLLVEKTMSRIVHACRPDDSIEAAEELMRRQEVRRLPVTDEQGRCVGITAVRFSFSRNAGNHCAKRVFA